MGNGCVSQRSGLVVNHIENLPNFKIVLVGDPGVGKSSICLRFIKNQFDSNYSSTPKKKVVIENVVKKLNVPKDMVVSVTLWDTPGTDDLDLHPTYFRNVDALIVVVDINNKDYIELAGIWKQDFINKATKMSAVTETLPNGIKTFKLELDDNYDPRKVPVVLLGNKYDLLEEESQKQEMHNMLQADVNQENRTPTDTEEIPYLLDFLKEAEAKHNFTTSMAVSAKHEDGSVDLVFQAVIRMLLENGQSRHIKKTNECLTAKENNRITLKRKKSKIMELKKSEVKLKDTGIYELDELFQQCNAPMEKAYSYKTYYDICFKRFKQSCADHGLLSESKVSLEDCIISIKDYVNTNLHRPLLAEDDEDFLRLYYNSENTEEEAILMKQQKMFNMFLEQFHEEYIAICKAILKNCPAIETELQKQLGSIREKMQMRTDATAADDTQNADQKPNINWQNVCTRNNARLLHCINILKEIVLLVKSAKKKITAALLW